MDETAFSATNATYTLASEPGAAALSDIGTSSIKANWTAGTPANPGGTQYLVECWQGATCAAPSTYVDSSGWVASLDNLFSGLTPNTQYSFQVKAKNGNDVETAFTPLGTVYTLANTPGTLTIDMDVYPKLTGPGCHSLTLESIDLNSNPPDTLIAIKVQSNGWLKFVGVGAFTDIYTDGVAEEWHTAADWAGKRIRGLDTNTVYTFEAKAKNDDTPAQETALTVVAAESTNKDGDVNRDSIINVLDLILARGAVFTGGQIGQDYSWCTDVDDLSTRRTDVGDMAYIRSIILNPPAP